VRLGATYIQLDAPHYPLLIDPAYREFYESRGWPADRWIELGTDLDNLVMADHPGVVFGFHLCRGNQMSRWLVSGGYDWLAGRLFPRVSAEDCSWSMTTSARVHSTRSQVCLKTRRLCSVS
jgi:5-methyltetrahydropteroyltriglutamate--homocysteine methyltransferase